MAAVKPITELTTAPDGCFAFVESSVNVSIVYDTPSGQAEYTNFEAFSHPDGTLIRFPNMPISGGTPWSMRVVVDSGNATLLHWHTYEQNYESWENLPLRPHQFLGFLKSVDTKIINHANRVVSAENRCDDTMYGPRMYFPTDGIKPTPLDFSLVKESNFGGFFPILNVNGIAHVTSQIVPGIDMTWRNWPVVTLVSRTLSGMLRQISEWRDLYIAGIATEDFAEDAAAFFENLGISESMIDELKNSEVPMPVERFMRGYGDPRHGFSETGNLPESIKNHLKKQLRYATLSSLEKQHPLHPQIDEALKLEEKKTQQEALLVFIFNRMPSGTDPDTVTPQMVLDCADNYGQYALSQLPAPETYEYPMIEKARMAAKYFYAIR